MDLGKSRSMYVVIVHCKCLLLAIAFVFIHQLRFVPLFYECTSGCCVVVTKLFYN